jgi:hypothetical protein
MLKLEQQQKLIQQLQADAAAAALKLTVAAAAASDSAKVAATASAAVSAAADAAAEIERLNSAVQQLKDEQMRAQTAAAQVLHLFFHHQFILRPCCSVLCIQPLTWKLSSRRPSSAKSSRRSKLRSYNIH